MVLFLSKPHLAELCPFLGDVHLGHTGWDKGFLLLCMLWMLWVLWVGLWLGEVGFLGLELWLGLGLFLGFFYTVLAFLARVRFLDLPRRSLNQTFPLLWLFLHQPISLLIFLTIIQNCRVRTIYIFHN